MSPTYYVHPEFGFFCLPPAARRELRVAVASILFGMVIGATVVTVGAGHAVELDRGSNNAHFDTLLPGPGASSSQFEDVDSAHAGNAESIRPYPMRMVRVRSSKGLSPLAGIPLGVPRLQNGP